MFCSKFINFILFFSSHCEGFRSGKLTSQIEKLILIYFILFSVLVWIDTAAAVYNLIQLFRSRILTVFTKDQTTSHVYVAWGVYLLDQVSN